MFSGQETGAYKPLENKPYFLMEAYSLKDDYFNYQIHRVQRLKRIKIFPLHLVCYQVFGRRVPYLILWQLSMRKGKKLMMWCY